jgi:hypothetical protein
VPCARCTNDFHPRGAETRLARRSREAEPVVLENPATSLCQAYPIETSEPELRAGKPKRTRSTQVFELLEADVLLAVSALDREWVVYRVVGSNAPTFEAQGTSHPEVALSPRLSLRRTKTASQEPTVAKSSDWRCSEEGRIYEENRRWARGGFPFSKPSPSAARPPHRGEKPKYTTDFELREHDPGPNCP